MHSGFILTILAAATSTVSAAACRPGYVKAGNDEGVRCYQVKCNNAIRGAFIHERKGRNIRDCVQKCYAWNGCDSVDYEKETGLCVMYDGNPRFSKNSAYDGALLLDSVDRCFD